MVVSRGVTHLEIQRLKSLGSGEPAARHKGLPMAVSCVRVPTRNGEIEQARQRRITWSVLRGSCEGKPKTTACGTPVASPAFAVTTIHLHFLQLVQMAVEDGNLPASPPPSSFLGGANEMLFESPAR